MDRSLVGSTRGKEVKHLISFAVGAEEYGLELLRVKEVIRMRQIVRLPNAPVFMKGIINLRGDVIPIVDLRGRFGLESGEQTASTRIIVVEVRGQLVGMVVDSSSEVVRVPADQIEPPSPLLRSGAQDFITGVAKMSDRLVILIDVDKVFSTNEIGQIASRAPAAVGEPALRAAS
jgi:purine-binding chemotaxis protein CheW